MKSLMLFKTEPLITLLVHIYFYPNLVINDDMEWVTSKRGRLVELMRLLKILINIQEGCLTKQVFLWDKVLKTKPES